MELASLSDSDVDYDAIIRKFLMRDLRFTRWWRFKSRSSRSWRRVVLR